jgi:hypothetical protein
MMHINVLESKVPVVALAPANKEQTTSPDKMAELRGKVVSLETQLLQMPQLQITPRHYFAEGLYAREITIPAGTLLTGKIHLFEHLNIISKGDISVMTEDGIKRIVAPATLISKPGIKRVGYAHAETVWTTIHACSETDPDKAEEMLVVGSYEELEKRLKSREVAPCLSSGQQ